MTILTQLIEFILLKRKLQDIQYNPTVMVLCFAMYCGIGYYASLQLLAVLSEFTGEPVEANPFAMALINMVVLTLFLYVLFEAKERSERFVQSATAYFGSAALLSLISIGLSYIPGSILLAAFLAVWQTVLAVRILMEALEYKALIGFFSYIGIHLLAAIVSSLLFSIVA